MSLYDENKELSGLNSDKHIFNTQIDSLQHSLYNQMKNGGLGDDIIKTLREPMKVSRFKVFRFKLKMFFSKIFEAL